MSQATTMRRNSDGKQRTRNGSARRRKGLRRRRGILILVVLTLLFLFVLVAVTYVLVANRHRAVSTTAAQADLTGDTPQQEIEMSLMALTRGDNNPMSPFFNTSLLEDMYGHLSVSSQVGGYAASPIKELYLLTLSGLPSTIPNYYDGRVVTIISGPGKGSSSRIVASDSGGKLYLLPFRDTLGATVSPTTQSVALVNSLEFSGTGVGYDQSTGRMDKQFAGKFNTANVASATAPNPIDFLLNGVDPTGDGGANEPYDAPDFQNPFLAYFDLSSNPAQLSTALIKPSFHDPALIAAAGSETLGNSFRPLRTYHPNFTGSNPSYNYATGPWDVDNDGDGIADSIWIDPGFPVLTTKDGRLYKRLIAPLILDLDGRINVNTAGNRSQDATFATATVTAPFAGTSGAVQLPAGSGYGPSEINLGIGLADPTRALQVMQTRYGSNQEAGRSNTPVWSWLLKGFQIPRDFTAAVTDYSTFNSASAYGTSPSDVWGRAATGIDWQGNPLFVYKGAKTLPTDERLHIPYEMNFGRNVPRGQDDASNTLNDNQFSAGELESLLRGYDSDAGQIPSRLRTALNGIAHRNHVTTDSWETPVTSALGLNSAGIMTGHILEVSPFSGMSQTIVGEILPPELLSCRKMILNIPLGNGLDDDANGVIDDFSDYWSNGSYKPNTDPAYKWQYSKLTFEAGQTNGQFGTDRRMGLSRGVDVNKDGVIDEKDNIFIRQQVAKYLYVLMMWSTGEIDSPTEASSRRIAQWAINAVEFMDTDNIMTPFEYALDPRNAWPQGADGLISDNEYSDGKPTSGGYGLVWGCEAPMLLLTESLAWHDRRVRDSAFDDGVGKKRDDNNQDDSNPKDMKRDDDPDMDQAFIPRGETFIEMYATHSAAGKIACPDFYDFDTTTQNWRLKLDKIAPSSATSGSPVWRIVVTTTGTNFLNPPDGANATYQTPQSKNANGNTITPNQNGGGTWPGIDRVIYFVRRNNIGPEVPDQNLIYCFDEDSATPAPSTFNANGRIENLSLYGGQYAVLFPGGKSNAIVNGTTHRFPLGHIINQTDPKLRDVAQQEVRITYSANTNPFTSSGKTAVQFHGSDGNNHQQPASNYNTPATIPIGSFTAPANWGGDFVGLSISEPIYSAANYYPKPDVASGTGSGLTEAYGDPAETNDATGKFLDKPLDSQVGMPLRDDGILATGTRENYKTLVLQRLADPMVAFHPDRNPYITVDWLPIDITVFNGDDLPVAANAVFDDTLDPDDPNGPTAKTKIGSRQRAENPADVNAYTVTTPPPAPVIKNLWRQQSGRRTDDSKVSTQTGLIFKDEIIRDDGTPAQSLGYLNQSYGDPEQNPGDPRYVGSPSKSIPNLSWPNRPYSNALELMRVPAASANRLFAEAVQLNSGPTLVNYAAQNLTADPASQSFGHLLNFFSFKAAAGTQPERGCYRIFDLVTTMPRYAGTEEWITPESAESISTTDPTNPLMQFRIPFNFTSNYREPGRMNINTVCNENSWEAIKNGWHGPSFEDLVVSRRGVANVKQLSATTLPTYWGNPFRSAGAANLVPTGTTPTMQRRGINVGLLRAPGNDPDSDSSGYPLLGHENDPGESHNDYEDPTRHRIMALQPIERLANLTTDKSNVYAMWVTVGYFEVTPSNAAPGGYQIGQELGIDTGEIVRHRGFGILDRTIPVGFQRGLNHNVDKAFLIKKMLE